LPVATTAVAVIVARTSPRVRRLRSAREICARSNGENRSVMVTRSPSPKVLFAARVRMRFELARRRLDGTVTNPCAETVQGP
jgi:phosphoribosylanthranilate isomerase